MRQHHWVKLGWGRLVVVPAKVPSNFTGVVGMNTWRVCAAIGLGLTFAIASGCNSDSDKKNDGGGGRDTGFGRDQSIGRDSTSGQPCVYQGQTYDPGETLT